MLPDWLQNSYSQIIRNHTGSKKYFLIRFFLQLASYPIAFIALLRNKSYQSGLFKKTKISRPVISVGNITVGGSGKTPCCIHLLNLLVSKNVNPALVSRGYGNDESIIYQNTFPNLKMGFQGDRVSACQNLLSSHPEIDCFLLDDAYQHQRIARDLNILLINSREPFGLGYHLPRGYLRESINNIHRADLILLTHANAIPKENLLALKSKCKQLSKSDTPILEANHEHDYLLTPENSTVTLEAFSNQAKENAIGLFCGIANPASFFEIIHKFNREIAEEISYGDHHQYNEKDFALLKNKSLKIDRWITTEKDAVKIPPELIKELNIYILKMKLNIIDPEDIISKKIDELLK